jgi:hypothetical protein
MVGGRPVLVIRKGATRFDLAHTVLMSVRGPGLAGAWNNRRVSFVRLTEPSPTSECSMMPIIRFYDATEYTAFIQ